MSPESNFSGTIEDDMVQETSSSQLCPLSPMSRVLQREIWTKNTTCSFRVLNLKTELKLLEHMIRFIQLTSMLNLLCNSLLIIQVLINNTQALHSGNVCWF